MEKAKIDRINYLAKKSRESGLTEAEICEQAILRQEYRDSFKASLTAHLENISIVEPDGSVVKVKEKDS